MIGIAWLPVLDHAFGQANPFSALSGGIWIPATDTARVKTNGTWLRLMLGGNLTGRIWTLHTRVRFFDHEQRRAGLPSDVASLVTKMEGGLTNVTLVPEQS